MQMFEDLAQLYQGLLYTCESAISELKNLKYPQNTDWLKSAY